MLTSDSFGHSAALRAAAGPYGTPGVRGTKPGGTRATSPDEGRDGVRTAGRTGFRRAGCAGSCRAVRAVRAVRAMRFVRVAGVVRDGVRGPCGPCDVCDACDARDVRDVRDAHDVRGIRDVGHGRAYGATSGRADAPERDEARSAHVPHRAAAGVASSARAPHRTLTTSTPTRTGDPREFLLLHPAQSVPSGTTADRGRVPTGAYSAGLRGTPSSGRGTARGG